VTISASSPPADELRLVLGTVVCSSQQPVREKDGGGGLEIPLRIPLIQEQDERPQYQRHGVVTAMVGGVIAAMALATIIYQLMVGNSALLCPLLIGMLAGGTILFGVSLLTYRVSHIPSPALLREGKLWLRGVNAQWLSGSTSAQSNPPTPVASFGSATLLIFSFSNSCRSRFKQWFTCEVVALPGLAP
jgi:hypothetical protein